MYCLIERTRIPERPAVVYRVQTGVVLATELFSNIFNNYQIYFHLKYKIQCCKVKIKNKKKVLFFLFKVFKCNHLNSYCKLKINNNYAFDSTVILLTV